MDVVVHHTTVSGDFALCRSRWRITGTDKDGNPIEVHHHGMEVAVCKAVGGSSSSTTLREPTRRGQWIVLHQRLDGHGRRSVRPNPTRDAAGRVCTPEKMLAIQAVILVHVKGTPAANG